MMRYSKIWVICFVASFVLLQPDKGLAQQAKDLEGVWELVSFNKYKEGVIQDTTKLWKGYKQVKMYSKGYVMWVRDTPEGHDEWYGYGTYISDGETLVENLQFGSDMLMKSYKPDFEFELILSKDSFRQITRDKNGVRVSAENYRRIK